MSRSSSAVVDSKIVEMSFENSNFEKNATTSLSTIQKLKQALNFSTSNDGLDKVGASVKKINFNPLSAGIDAAKEKMSAFEAVSLGFFTKIGSRIEETVHKYTQMFSATKMAMDGFSEYELKMGSVQTILMGAKTAEGLPVTLDMVNQKLDELNTYADKTIYSFSDMTSNIGKFTNAGVDLNTAVAAIQGISNEAALAGANAQQASHAMYNFAQALSSGSVKLIDWKSIENANMATVDFKQTLIDTAVEIGTLTKVGDKYVSTTTDLQGKVSQAFNATSMFNDSLSAQWMSTEVLTAALAKYADGTTELGQKAFKAATEVKTFSQLIDTLQEAMGSGWAQTWEIVIGDFEQSKELFTMLSDTFGGIIEAQAKARNSLLEGGLGKASKQVTEDYIKSLGMTESQLDRVSAKLIDVGKEHGIAFKTEDAKGFVESLKDGWLNTDMLKTALQDVNTEGLDTKPMVKSLDEFSDAALRVINGDYTNDMTERFKMLNDEGFDAQKVQDYVNEIYRLTDGTYEVNDAILAEAAANVGLSESMEGVSGGLDDIIKKISSETYKKSGRELLFDALKTSMFSLKTIFGEVKGAFREVFPPATADTVYKIARGINDASKALRRFAFKNADNIHSTFLGIFKALDLVLHTGKTVISTVFKGISNFFKGGDGKNGILAFTGNIGNLITKFHDWVIENEIVEKALGKVGDAITAVASTVGRWVNAFMQLPAVQKVVESFSETFAYLKTNFTSIIGNAGQSLSDFGKRVKDAFSNIKSPKDFFDSIKNAFSNLFSDISSSTVFQKISDAFGSIGTAVKTFFTDLGTNADGTRNTFGKLTDGFGKFITNIKNLIKGVDGNGEKIDVLAGVKSSFANLGDDISASGVVDSIKSGLKTVWSVIDGFFTSLGSNANGTKNLFGQVWEGLTTGLGWVVDKAIAAKDAIHGFFTEHKLGKFFGDTFADISTATKNVFTTIPKVAGLAKDRIGKFFESVKELGGLKLSNFTKVWDLFKQSIADIFTKNDLFKPIALAFENIKNRIVEKLGEFGISIGAIKDKIVEFFAGIGKVFSGFKFPDIFGNLVKMFTGAKEGVQEGAEGVSSGLSTFIEKAKELTSKIPVGLILNIVKAFAAFKALKFLKSLAEPIKAFMGALTAEKKASANQKNALANVFNKAAMIELAVAVGIFALVVKELAELPLEGAIQGVAAFAAIATILGVFSRAVSKNDPKGMAMAGTSLLETAIAVGVFVYAIKVMGEMLATDWKKVVTGVLGLAGILAILIGVLAIIKKINGNGSAAALSGAGLLGMVSALLEFCFGLVAISLIPWGMIESGILKMAAILALFLGALFIIKKIVGDGMKFTMQIVGLAGIILALAGALWIVSTIDFGRAMGAVLALGLLMAALMGVIWTLKEVDAGLGKVIGIVALIVALAGSLMVLSAIDPDALKPATLAMMGVMALLAVLVGVAGLTKPAMGSLLAIMGIVAVIGIVLYALASLPNPDAVMGIALGMSALLLAIVAALGVATIIGHFAGAALAGLGVLALFIAGFTALAWAIGALAGGEGETIKQGVQIIIDVLSGLGTAIGKFVGNLVAESFGALPAVAESIVEFMRKLSELNGIGMVDIGPLLEALGGIFGVSIVGFADSVLSIVSELEEGKSAAEMLAEDMNAIADAFEHYQTAMDRVDGINIDSGPLLEAIGTTFVASLAGFGDSLLSIVSELEEGKSSVQMISDDMSALADGFANYADTMSRFQGITIDTTGLDSAVDQVLHASLVGFADGLTSIITEIQEGKTSVQTVADDMSALADGFSDYADAMSRYETITIDTQAISDLTDAIGEVSLQGLLDSLMNLIPSGDTKTQVERFSEDMGALADALVEWQNQMAPLSSITVPTDSIDQIKKAMDSIKEGGIIDDILNFFGVDTTPDYTSFTEGVKGLGKAINDFANSLGENFDQSKLNTAVNAIKKLSQVGVALGDVDFGGWFHDGVLTSFANELVEMAPKLNDFVSGFASLDQFTQVSEGVSKIATAASKISNIKFSGGDLTKSDVVNILKANVDSLSKIMQSLTKIDTSAVDKVTKAFEKLNGVSIGDAMKKVNDLGSLGSLNLSGMATGKKLTESVASGVTSEPIARALKKAISASVTSVDTSNHKSVGTKLGKAVVTGIESITSTLKTTTQKLGTTFGATFTSSIARITASIKASAQNVGTAFGTSLSQGITSGMSRVKSAAQSVAKGAVDAANSQKGSFHGIGLNFSLGLANGIAAGRSAAISAAIRVASDALAAAKAKLQEHSPSKATFEMGMFFDLGLANGIKRYSSRVANESESVASIAMDGLKEAVKLTSQMVLGDGMDQPVITPVVDLSEIQNGANMIGSIFDSARPDVTLGNLSAINLNTNMMRQRAENNDLLNAITSLESTLSGRSGDTYNINGITYDDGSNVSDAVRRLIRAVKVERRA